MSNNPQTEAELTAWRKHLKIGDLVVTNEFKDISRSYTPSVLFHGFMNRFIGEAGFIEKIDHNSPSKKISEKERTKQESKGMGSACLEYICFC